MDVSKIRMPDGAEINLKDAAARTSVSNLSSSLSTVAISGSYNDLEDKPSFYQKPSTGIPKSDMASDIQTSLGKADTALQQHQDISGKADKSATVSNISYNGTTQKLQKTINGVTSDVVTIISGGFQITMNETTGIDNFVAIGGASITYNTSNGIDSFVY